MDRSKDCPVTIIYLQYGIQFQFSYSADTCFECVCEDIYTVFGFSFSVHLEQCRCCAFKYIRTTSSQIIPE